MLCEKCKMREATYHSSVNINGSVTESHLCSECAISENKISNLFNVGKLFNMPNFEINTDLVSHKPQKAQTSNVCEVCGKTFDNFINDGVVGCSNCYVAFKENLLPIIQTVQYGTKHVGKVMENLAESNPDEKNIKALEFKLKQAVASENYELASQIKKQINDLKNGGN